MSPYGSFLTPQLSASGGINKAFPPFRFSLSLSLLQKSSNNKTAKQKEGKKSPDSITSGVRMKNERRTNTPPAPPTFLPLPSLPSPPPLPIAAHFQASLFFFFSRRVGVCVCMFFPLIPGGGLRGAWGRGDVQPLKILFLPPGRRDGWPLLDAGRERMREGLLTRASAPLLYFFSQHAVLSFSPPLLDIRIQHCLCTKCVEVKWVWN